MSQRDTKERILDAAERLFALEGFHTTSLRAITGAAGVNLAAVHYHFGSKEALLEAILDRRLGPLNASRREKLEAALQAAERGGSRPGSRQVLRAFIEPTFRFRAGGSGAEEFITLLGRALAEPDDTIRRIFIQRMEPTFHQFYNAFALALPDLPREILFWRLHFIIGAMSHTICLSGRLGVLPPEMTPPADADELSENLIDFLAAGLESP